jgi:hypothetical protein
MSKYQPLADRLAGHEGDEWRASFEDLEKMLGFALPKAARSGGAWWAKQGFTARADAKTGEVAFRRGDISPAAMQAVLEAPEPEPAPQPPVVKVPGEPREFVVPTAKGWGVIAAAVAGFAVVGLAVAGIIRKRQST